MLSPQVMMGAHPLLIPGPALSKFSQSATEAELSILNPAPIQNSQSAN